MAKHHLQSLTEIIIVLLVITNEPIGLAVHFVVGIVKVPNCKDVIN